MGEIINNFFLSLTMTSDSAHYIAVFLIYFILIFCAYRICTDKAGDGCFFLIIFQIALNITYCVSMLPDTYLFITKLIIGIAPYFLVGLSLIYLDFRKKGDKND